MRSFALEGHLKSCLQLQTRDVNDRPCVLSSDECSPSPAEQKHTRWLAKFGSGVPEIMLHLITASLQFIYEESHKVIKLANPANNSS